MRGQAEITSIADAVDADAAKGVAIPSLNRALAICCNDVTEGAALHQLFGAHSHAGRFVLVAHEQ